ncbi:MAG TPA: thermonuclease family protein [Allosphingosinicella sp.]|nr:thermonuclease family protein [Allosphingosinicella sp.]
MGKRRPSKAGWAGQWDWHVWNMPSIAAHRRRKQLAEARVALWCGLLLGLLGFNATQFLPARATTEAVAPVADATWGRSGGSVRVIDGDTFDYAGERIRIADIDTPELRARCEEESRLARAATARLRSLLTSGPFELKRLGRDEDRYGRKLRIVTRGGHSLGDVLVSEGLARTWTGRREPWC